MQLKGKGGRGGKGGFVGRCRIEDLPAHLDEARLLSP